MATKSGQQVIAIEEHYWDPEMAASFNDGATGGAQMRLLLEDIDGERIRQMDAGGVDIQVLSHGAPGAQRLDPKGAVALTRGANDRLRDICAARPDRFAGFAALPTTVPEACADELERAVTELGMKGAMIHGLTGDGIFFDDKRFWPVYARAQALDVPLYMHPAVPHKAVVDAYYGDYIGDYPALLNAAWGFTVETATQGIRIVLSGVLDEYPDVKVVLGHLGEGLPFLLWRIDHALSRPGNRKVNFREKFSHNFWITTSGNFSDPALLCSIQELGVDRILFALDWPFVENGPGVDWLDGVQMNQEDKNKILHGNAKKLLKM
jgi:predicted TIM-barrel fold metal-dependent hydrolase